MKNDLIFCLVRVALAVAIRVPSGAARRLGRLIGEIVHAVHAPARRRARENLAAVFSVTGVPLRQQCREHFQTLGANLMDTIQLLRPHERADRTLRFPEEARETLKRSLEAGRGVLLISAHLGPWERMGSVLAEAGFPIHAVTRSSYDPRFDALIYRKLRDERGVRSIARGDAHFASKILRPLRSGEIVALLIDLPGRVDTAAVSFLGQTGRLASGAARLARASGAEIVIATPAPPRRRGDELGIVIERADLHAFCDGDGGQPATRMRETETCRMTQYFADRLSERIRALPMHWIWSHSSFEARVPGCAHAVRSQVVGDCALKQLPHPPMSP